MRSGTSLLDLTVALALAGLGVSLLLPAAHRQIDRFAVLAAREAVVTQVARARREARLTGGARLELRREGGRVWIESDAPPGDTLSVEARWGVGLDPGADVATLAFDGLGVGRLANRSVTLAKGEARAGLTVSAYGRVRRR